MKDAIEKAIEYLANKSADDKTVSHEALHYTQAALNLAHVNQVIEQTKNTKY